MSGKRVKRAVSGITRVAGAALTGGASELGGDKSFGRGLGDTAGDVAGGLAATASGETKRAEKDAQAAQEADVRRQGIAREEADNERKRAAATSADNARMAQGERSQTLLTGGDGLEDDEEGSISKRTLSGR